MKQITIITLSNKQAGPYSEEEVKKLVEDGIVSKETMAWETGTNNWVPLYTLLPDIPPPLPQSTVAPTNYPGIGRLAYFLWNILFSVFFLVIIAASSANPAAGAIGGLFLLAILVGSFVITVFRLQNMGSNPLWCVLLIVPIVNFFITIPCLIAPAGYAYTKKLDQTGKIIVWICIGFFVLCFLLPTFILILVS